jgi:rod shape-determining protein MreD
MRKNIMWAVIVVTAALIQTTWLDAIRIAGVVPDLTLLLVVYFAVNEGEERAMFTGVLAGVFQDVASRAALGHHVLCLVLIGYTVGRLTTRLITEHPAIKAGLVFAAGLVNGIVYTAILYVQEPSVTAARTIAAHVVPTAFYTAFVTPFVFLLLSKPFRRDGTPAGGTN